MRSPPSDSLGSLGSPGHHLSQLLWQKPSNDEDRVGMAPAHASSRSSLEWASVQVARHCTLVPQDVLASWISSL